MQKEQEELEEYQNLKDGFEEKENILNNKLLKLKNVNNILKEIKLFKENEKIEIEKLKIKEDIKKQNQEKISILSKEITGMRNEIAHRKIRKLNIVFLFLVLINILQFILIKNKQFNYSFISVIPIFLIYYLFKIINKNKRSNAKKENKISSNIINSENEIKIIENNQKDFEQEINNIKSSLKSKNILEKQKIIDNYEKYIENNKINYFWGINDLNTMNYEIEKNLQEINESTLKLHTLNLERKNTENKLESLSKMQEEIIDFSKKKENLQNLNFSMNLAKDILEEAYEEIRRSVTPKFTEKLSTNISRITNGRYNNVKINEDEGLMVELESGDYIPVNKLSIGTIDQLYFSLRLSMLDDLTEENLPILLDESFAFYDNERLENILVYLNELLRNRQIIIFTCTNREKEILEKNNIFYNYLEL